jgi:hypothetical protein
MESDWCNGSGAALDLLEKGAYVAASPAFNSARYGLIQPRDRPGSALGSIEVSAGGTLLHRTKAAAQTTVPGSQEVVKGHGNEDTQEGCRA